MAKWGNHFNRTEEPLKKFILHLASMILSLLPALAHAQPYNDDPPTIDLSNWVQADINTVYGDQWPGGVNPEFASWVPPDDGRAFSIKSDNTSITREYSFGDPPLTVHYTSFTDIVFEYWIGDDKNLHYFGWYKYENSKGTLINNNFIGTLYVQPGQSAQELFKALAATVLSTDLTTYTGVTTIPEPNAALMLATGLILIKIARSVQSRRTTRRPAS